MTKKFKIVCKYIKDLSSETPDIETYLYVKECISKYKLGIEITTKALKNKLIEVNTKLKFEDHEKNKKKSTLRLFMQLLLKYKTILRIKRS